MHACVCISTCDCFHLRVQVCECECVCAQAEARSPPGTCDHTQHSNIWQQTCGAAANKWACSAGSPPPDPPTEREGERLSYCTTAYNLPSFVLVSGVDRLTCAHQITEQGMQSLMLCGKEKGDGAKMSFALFLLPVFYRCLNFMFCFINSIFNSFNSIYLFYFILFYSLLY